MSPHEISLEGTGAQPDARAILGEMVAKLVALSHEPSQQ
jgi:hypothetical protein